MRQDNPQPFRIKLQAQSSGALVKCSFNQT